MATIIGLCGGLRRASFNLMLLHAAAEATPSGTSIEIESIREIPLYDGDDEAEQGIPPPVHRLKDRIAGADGVLIVTPEYNNSMPGVLKNAIDWLSRPASDIGRVSRGRPVAVMGATPGPGGTALSQAAWLPVLRTLGMRPWFEGRVLISGAGKVFDTNGRVVDAATQERIRTFVEGFAAFVDAQRRQNFGPAQSRLIDVYLVTGQYSAAEALLPKRGEALGDASLQTAQLYAKTGRSAEARTLMISSRTAAGGGIGVGPALVAVALGQHDAALDSIERAVRARRLPAFSLRDPRLDPIVSSPRFRQVLRNMNLPE